MTSPRAPRSSPDIGPERRAFLSDDRGDLLRTGANVLVTGPASALEGFVQAAAPFLRRPLRRMRCDNALTLGHFDGTVILDGVERLDVAQQRTLLAWLDEHWRTQIVSLTCERLHDRVRTGGFRNELYYLLNVICVELWPSREVGH